MHRPRHTPRPLTFLPRPAEGDLPARYVALVGAWPDQHRYTVTKAAHEWRLSAEVHVPGRGWEDYSGRYEKTLRKAQAVAAALADPEPVDRTSSSYTDG